MCLSSWKALISTKNSTVIYHEVRSQICALKKVKCIMTGDYIAVTMRL
jgi:hypothetical protein